MRTERASSLQILPEIYAMNKGHECIDLGMREP